MQTTIPYLLESDEIILILKRPMSLPYRNQSIDLLCKSIDWFLYETEIGR